MQLLFRTFLLLCCWLHGGAFAMLGGGIGRNGGLLWSVGLAASSDTGGDNDDGDPSSCERTTTTTEQQQSSSASVLQHPAETTTTSVGSKETAAAAEGSEESSSSWWEGMEFEKHNNPETDNNEQFAATESSVLSDYQLHPLLQIPVSLSPAAATAAATADSTTTTTKAPLFLLPVKTFCDTGVAYTTLSWRAIVNGNNHNNGGSFERWLLTQLNMNKQQQQNNAKLNPAGLTNHVMGQLPAGLMELHLFGTVTVPSPPIFVIMDDESEVEDETNKQKQDAQQQAGLRLGLDFLRSHRAILDLREEELRLVVNGTEHEIPFLKPRGGNFAFGS